jgi:hypothetical protein
MSKSTDFMIKEMLDGARIHYQALQDLKELDHLLNDPLLVNNKEMAAGICSILIKMLIGEGVVKEGSIAHRLGLRLLDYIRRVHDEGPEKLR